MLFCHFVCFAVFPSLPNQLLGRDVRQAGRQAIVLDIRCASVQGHTGSVVRRQAAHNLTPKCFSQWRREAALGRGRRETHQIDHEKSVNFHIKVFICRCYA